jgi:hypothetical protein
MPQPHLDPETVAAFVDRRLDARQRSRVFEHLVLCEDCREWIAVHAEVSEPVGHRPTLRKGLCAAAAAVVLLCVGGWLLHRPEPAVTAPAVQVARQARTYTFVKQEPSRRYVSLPVAWQQVRLAPDLLQAPPDGQFVLKTVVGEKWIPLGAGLRSVVP